MKGSKLMVSLVLFSLVAAAGCVPVAAPPPATATPAPVSEAPAPAAAEDTSPWKVIQQMKVKHATTVAAFLDDTLGITAGYAGEVHYTADGGQTWPRAENASMCRFGVDIVNQNQAWHVGNGGNVRVSTDGGQKWTAVANLSSGGISQFISFVDAKTGWAANRTTLWATADGGQKWTAVALPEGAKKLVEIALRTASDGYLLDEAGVLYITQDGGQHWSSQALELKDGAMALIKEPHGAALRFFDADHGVIIASLAGGGSSKLVALRTADGGKTWQKEDISVPALIASLYLTHDGTTLTIFDATNQLTVLRYTGAPLARADN
jgi:photosystem II stability/assembly factor-like uncharacterized protein